MKDNKERTYLPVLRGGEILINAKGKTFRVHRVGKPKRDLICDEPVYRLEYLRLVGHGEFTLDELNEAGLKVME